MFPETLRERWHAFWWRVKSLVRRGELDRDLQDELEFHAAMRAKKLSSAGLAADAARHQAARQFGNATLTRETLRETRGFPLIESIVQDARYAVRQLRRNSGFAAVAILTLALGIGVTTAVFSLVDEALFRPLPYPHGDRLVTVGVTAPIERGEFITSSSYYDLRDNQTPFESVASWIPGVFDCDLAEPSVTRLNCARVESTFLPTLQIEPILGRNFSAAEDRSHVPQTALISYPLWRSHFREDPNIIGRVVSLDGVPVRIVGVLPRSFEMPSQAHVDILIPQALDETAQRAAHPGLILRAYARLRPGISPIQAVAQLHSVFERMVRSAPPQFRDEIHPSVRSVRSFQTENLRLALLVLFGAVLAVLLIACANIGNLLLARAASRRAEMAVRVALGAGRSRLTRQSFTETLVLAACGGVFGCLLAALLLRGFDSYTALIFPRFALARLDGRVLAFAGAISLFSALLFGAAPVLSLPKAEFLGSARAVNISRSGLSWPLITFQVGASLVLLTAAGLLLRTLWRIENANLGMDMEHVIVAQITLSKEEYSAPTRRTEFFDQLESGVSALPGIAAFAISDTVPPAGGMNAQPFSAITAEGHLSEPDGPGGMVAWRAVTPGYFETLRIPILRGRAFVQEDRNSNDSVIVLSETLARRIFGREDAINARIRVDPESPWYTVIGVAADVKNGGIVERADPEYYILRKEPMDVGSGRLPDWYRRAVLLLRTSLSEESVADWLKSKVKTTAPAAAVNIFTMRERISELTERQRFNAILLSVFGGVSLLLAAIGLFGVISFLVAQRTREIGVRMALGASPRNVLQLFLRRASLWVGAGAVAGLIGSFFATRLLQGLLYGVPATDPPTWLAAFAVLAGVAFAAVWIPARRAAKTDPIVALRYE